MNTKNKIKKLINANKYINGTYSEPDESSSQGRVVFGVFFQTKVGYNGVDMSGIWDFIPENEIENIQSIEDFEKIAEISEIKYKDNFWIAKKG